MFAQLFGTPDSFSPAGAQPAAPERADEWQNLIDSIVDEMPETESFHVDAVWNEEEESATMRFQDSAGVWESCDAAIEQRDDQRAVISAPYALEAGDMLWLEDDHAATLYVVLRSSLVFDGSRLELRGAHVERRQMSRRDEECLGQLEVLTGEAVEARNVTVNNVSGGGAQIETGDPLPDWAPVRLTFRDRDLTGTVRYCRGYQGVYVAGIRFSTDGSNAD